MDCRLLALRAHCAPLSRQAASARPLGVALLALGPRPLLTNEVLLLLPRAPRHRGLPQHPVSLAQPAIELAHRLLVLALLRHQEVELRLLLAHLLGARHALLEVGDQREELPHVSARQGE